MCRSMADIRSTAAEIRRGKKEEEEEGRKEGKKLQGKNIMAPLLHRAAIMRRKLAISKKRTFAKISYSLQISLLFTSISLTTY